MMVAAEKSNGDVAKVCNAFGIEADPRAFETEVYRLARAVVEEDYNRPPPKDYSKFEEYWTRATREPSGEHHDLLLRLATTEEVRDLELGPCEPGYAWYYTTDHMPLSGIWEYIQLNPETKQIGESYCVGIS
jgi:hypothetical protein